MASVPGAADQQLLACPYAAMQQQPYYLPLAVVAAAFVAPKPCWLPEQQTRFVTM